MLLTTIATLAGAGVAGLGIFIVLTQVLGWQAGAAVWAPIGLAAILGGILGAYGGIKLGHRATRGFGSGQQSEEDAAQMRSLAGDGDGDLSHLKGVTGIFARLLGAALRNPIKVVLGAVCVLVSSWTAYVLLGNGVEFFPDIEPDQALVQVHARGNLAVDEKNGLVREVEQYILDIQEERGEFTSIYTLAGNTQTRDDQAEDIIGTISLEFGEWDERRAANEILADIAERTRGLAGIIVETRKAEQGPPTGKAIQVQLSSNNPELLALETAKVRRFIDGMQDLKDLEDSRPMPGIEWELTVDRAEAAKFGADVQLIGNAIKLVTNGIIISSFRPNDSDDEIDIVARYPLEYRTVSQLDEVRIKTRQGLVPISNFVQRQPVPRTGQLRRIDTARSLTVKADVLPGILIDDKVSEIRSWLETANIDPLVSVVFKGEDQEQKDAQAFLLKAFSVALFLIALILILQFNSFYSAFLILTAILISTSGVMLGLLVTGQPFGIVMSGVGVIALAGIVVNNNIVLIDTYNQVKRKVSDPYQAILRAVVQRFRPVLLTTATTTLGLMPMVLQLNINFVTREVAQGAPSTQWWVQLATAITAGLIFAVVPTLIVTPAALMIRENIRARRQTLAVPARDHPNTVGFPQAAE
ncbi:MAG: efflux RND transporter permease subunit [Alphaproteobacteria bacterium]